MGGLFGEGPSSCTPVASFEPLGLGVKFRASVKSSTPLFVSGHAQKRAPCRPPLLVRPRSGGPSDRRFRFQNSFFMGIGRKWFFAYNSGTRRSPESTLGWWRWIGDLELYYNPEFCEVLPRVGCVISGSNFQLWGPIS